MQTHSSPVGWFCPLFGVAHGCDPLERDGVQFKISYDPRITPVGRLLRKYSLEELLQFLNLPKSDMSIVAQRVPRSSEVQGNTNLACLNLKIIMRTFVVVLAGTGS
jgi:hypothetical protein